MSFTAGVLYCPACGILSVHYGSALSQVCTNCLPRCCSADDWTFSVVSVPIRYTHVLYTSDSAHVGHSWKLPVICSISWVMADYAHVLSGAAITCLYSPDILINTAATWQTWVQNLNCTCNQVWIAHACFIHTCGSSTMWVTWTGICRRSLKVRTCSVSESHLPSAYDSCNTGMSLQHRVLRGSTAQVVDLHACSHNEVCVLFHVGFEERPVHGSGLDVREHLDHQMFCAL